MRLKSLEVISAGGISPKAPIIIYFGDNHFVKAKGEMGTGKSSLIKALLVGTARLSKDDKDFINIDTNQLNINLNFEGKRNENYVVNVTKSQYKLVYEGESLKEPMTLAREIIGPVGMTPMPVKDQKFEVVLKFLAEYTVRGVEEFEKIAAKNKEGTKECVTTRADANKKAKGFREYLKSEGFVNDDGELIEAKWVGAEKKYAEEPDIKELSRKLTAAGNKSDKFIENEHKTNAQIERKKQIDNQIKTLQKELVGVEENISLGEKWLAANTTAKKDYDAIKKQYDGAAQDVADYNKWQEIKSKKIELDEYETIAQRADAKEKELLKELAELRSELIPNIKGLDLVMENEMKDGKLVRAQGLYWDGKNVSQLSQSEWWSVVMMIWRKNKVKVVAIDDYESLGSGAIEILQKLVNDGAYVLVAEMSRGQETLEIEYL